MNDYGWTSRIGLVLVDGGLDRVRTVWCEKREIKIVNKQAAMVESLIDGHRVKNVFFMNFVKPLSATSFHFCPASLDPLLYTKVQFDKANFFHQSIIFIACPAKSSTKMQMRKNHGLTYL